MCHGRVTAAPCWSSDIALRLDRDVARKESTPTDSGRHHCQHQTPWREGAAGSALRAADVHCSCASWQAPYNAIPSCSRSGRPP